MSNNDNDEFDDAPPIVPPRDEVASRQRGREQPDLVRPGQYAEKVKVSTWPVRIMLGLLLLAVAGGGGLGYWLHQQTLADLEQASSRIADLENRLASVGDSTEETTANILERLDMHFSEIDKLWAARNATDEDVEDLTGRVANVETSVEENQTTIEETNQRLVQSTNLVEETRQDLDSVRNELESTTEQVSSLAGSVRNLQTTSEELMDLTESMGSGEAASEGLSERVTRIEEAIEAIDSYRLQMNQTVRRLQDRIEELQGGG